MNESSIIGKSKLATNYAEASKLSNAGKFQLAVDSFRSLASQSIDPLEKANYLIEEAECHRHLMEFDKAGQCTTEAKQLVGSDVIASLQIRYFDATLLISQGRRDEALAELSKILKDHSQDLQQGEGRELHEQIQIERGFTLMHLERYADARLALEEVATFVLSADRRSDVQCHLGRCYFELGLYAEARLQFQQAEIIGISDEWSLPFHYYWGYTLYKEKEFAAARRQFLLCLQTGDSGPPASYVYKILAAVCSKEGDHKQARVYRKSAEK